MARTLLVEGAGGMAGEGSGDWIRLGFVLSAKGVLSALEVFKQVSDTVCCIYLRSYFIGNELWRRAPGVEAGDQCC